MILDSQTEPKRRLDLFLEPDVTEVAVPVTYLQPANEYVLEVLAIEASGNQTISVVNFFVEDER